MKKENIKIEELIDSFTKDEFGAVTAVINWLNDNMYFSKRIDELNEVILKRAEKDIS